jgi:histone H3/H4
MATKISKSAATKKVSTRKPRRTWSLYIQRAMKDVNKDISLSGKSMKIFNSFINDMFDRVAVQAAALARANKKSTLGAREVATAVRLTLPAELAKHAASEGVKAVSKASA